MVTSKAVWIGELSEEARQKVLVENEKLRQEVAGLVADRESLVEIATELRAVLQQIGRRAATARQVPRHWDDEETLQNWEDELIIIQDMCDKALRK